MAVIMRDKGCMPSTIGFYLVIIGAVNWGLVGLGDFFGGANWNIVHLIFGSMSWLEAAVYVVVGIAGVMTLMGCKCKVCSACRADMGDKKPM